MKLTDLKLSGQLGVGFGTIIVITIILGAVAVINMFGASGQADNLVEKYVPGTEVANDIERNSLLAMYAMRGYAFTEEQVYWTDGQKYLNDVKQNIQQSLALANKEDLEVLRTKTVEAEKHVNDYIAQSQSTHETNIELARIVGVMNTNAAEFVENCTGFLDEQHDMIKQNIRSGSGAATLLERETKIAQMNRIIDKGNELRIANFRSQATRNPELFKQALAGFDIKTELSEVRQITRQPANIQQLNKVEASANQYVAAMESYLEIWFERERLNAIRTETGMKVLALAQETSQYELGLTSDASVNMARSLSASSLLVIAGLIIAFIIALSFAIVITRSIVSGLTRGVGIAEVIAAGNLTETIEPQYLERKDEIGQLARAMSNMIEKLKEVIGSVINGSDNIAAASQQMSSTAQEMSQGGTEQASSAEEVSSSMEEMAANIQQNTDNARQTEKIARQAETGILESSKASEQAVGAMRDIAEKIGIIGEISRQTNILALNAAVEAARAGEHGKGFAVVAAEVRKLAERSQVAAAEIDKLSKFGVGISEEAGQKLAAIVPEIQKTARLVQEIAAASIEQNSGADQVNSAIQQLNQVTQQNAAASEEMATSSEELSSQADQLLDMVSYFKIDTNSLRSNKKAKNQGYAVKSFAAPKSSNGIKPGGNDKAKHQNGVILDMENGNKDAEYERY
jgi:methyl-accepting chemotaxis protein